MLFVIGMFSFEDIYRDFYTQLIYISDPAALHRGARPQDEHRHGVARATGRGILAMTFLSMIPLVAVFAVAQKNLTQGIAVTGLKE